MRDKLFRQWYDSRLGTKNESFAYDVWCAAWDAAKDNNLLKKCDCPTPERCDLYDKCLKNNNN